jgi:hypothetical protein
MLGYDCLWDLNDDLSGNVAHVAEHGLTKEDVEHALSEATEDQERFSESSGLPLIFGPALDGGTIVVIFDRIDDQTIYPVTAYRPTNERGQER